MKIKTLILFGVLALPALLAASITSPINDFKTGLTIPAGDKILKWETDVNGDGKNDVLLCLKSDADNAVESKEAPAWSLYIAEAAGNAFIKSEGTEHEANTLSVDDLPSIDTGTCYVGQITQLGKRGIVTMRIKNPRSGESVATIYAYTIEGNHLKYTQLAQYQPGQPNAVFDQYLKDNVRTQVQLQEVAP